MGLRICTFGSFDISCDDEALSAAPLRSGRTWTTLKYLIAHRDIPAPTEKLIDVLWPDEECDDPSKALRNIIYRLRKSLTYYGGSQQYIIFSQGRYSWNTEIPCSIDAAEFEQALRDARDQLKSVEERISLYNQAVALYKGEFLAESASELWVISFANHYKRLYLQAVDELADIYEQRFAMEEIILLYNRAISVEPNEEELYIRQIQALIQNGEYALAKRQYRHIERILRREFGTEPSKMLKSLLFEANKASDRKFEDLDEIKKRFEHGVVQKGAVFCGPETFRQIYCYDKRSEDRVPFPLFLGLIAMSDAREPSGGEEELKPAMKLLRQVMMQTLRRSDIICQYSPSQFVLMLTTMNNESAIAVLSRIQTLFEHQFGAGRIHFVMQVSPVGKAGPAP